MPKSQYQPTENKELSDAQEVHYAKAFKKADIAAGYRGENVKAAKKDNK